MILVVAGHDDEHAEAVVARLDELGRHVVRLDPGELAEGASLELGFGGGHHPELRLRTAAEDIDLNRAGVGWWRRLTPRRAGRDRIADLTAARESREVVDGVVASLAVDWLNPPSAEVTARRTLLQWTIAAELGFVLPRTIVTRDPARARAFVLEAGAAGVITKSLRTRADGVRDTHLLEASDLVALDRVRDVPTLLQEYIEGTDLRVTVVGDEVFTVEVDASADARPWDARRGAGASAIRRTELPGSLGEALVGLVHRLGLGYATVDLRLTPESRHVFLDLAPEGAWMFAERGAGVPITDAVARALAARDGLLCGSTAAADARAATGAA
ncbi:MvdC/MvdD family ATP grasp protein [Agromyces sp. MMS24-K17]|uniref:MvdC/MvdD family ATP grasp protein n=1 Tax=Agromyces sp. MMS24-K17 TaxID=3372850 RepID=UPI0037547936